MPQASDDGERKFAHRAAQSHEPAVQALLHTPRHRFTAPEAASGRRKGPGRRQVFKNDHDVASLGTSPADVLRLQLRLFL